MSAGTHYVFSPPQCPNRADHPRRGGSRHSNGCPTTADHVGTANVNRCLACRLEMAATARRVTKPITVSTSARFGAGSKELTARLAGQGGRCAACTEVLTRDNAHLDHDHATGSVRAYLCRGCNIALGMVRENPQRLRLLAAYIERHIEAAA